MNKESLYCGNPSPNLEERQRQIDFARKRLERYRETAQKGAGATTQGQHTSMGMNDFSRYGYQHKQNPDNMWQATPALDGSRPNQDLSASGLNRYPSYPKKAPAGMLPEDAGQHMSQYQAQHPQNMHQSSREMGQTSNPQKLSNKLGGFLSRILSVGGSGNANFPDTIHNSVPLPQNPMYPMNNYPSTGITMAQPPIQYGNPQQPLSPNVHQWGDQKNNPPYNYGSYHIETQKDNIAPHLTQIPPADPNAHPGFSNDGTHLQPPKNIFDPPMPTQDSGPYHFQAPQHGRWPPQPLNLPVSQPFDAHSAAPAQTPLYNSPVINTSDVLNAPPDLPPVSEFSCPPAQQSIGHISRSNLPDHKQATFEAPAHSPFGAASDKRTPGPLPWNSHPFPAEDQENNKQGQGVSAMHSFNPPAPPIPQNLDEPTYQSSASGYNYFPPDVPQDNIDPSGRYRPNTYNDNLPSQTFAPKSQVQTTSAYEPQTQGTPVYETQPQNNSTYETQPQNNSTYETQPQNNSTYETQPQSTSAYETQPQSTSAYESQMQNVSVYEPQIQNISAYEPQPQNAHTYEPQKQSTPTYGSQTQNASTYDSQPQATPAYGPQSQNITACGPQSHSVTAYESSILAQQQLSFDREPLSTTKPQDSATGALSARSPDLSSGQATQDIAGQPSIQPENVSNGIIDTAQAFGYPKESNVDGFDTYSAASQDDHNVIQGKPYGTPDFSYQISAHPDRGAVPAAAPQNYNYEEAQTQTEHTGVSVIPNGTNKTALLSKEPQFQYYHEILSKVMNLEKMVEKLAMKQAEYLRERSPSVSQYYNAQVGDAGMVSSGKDKLPLPMDPQYARDTIPISMRKRLLHLENEVEHIYNASTGERLELVKSPDNDVLSPCDNTLGATESIFGHTADSGKNSDTKVIDSQYSGKQVSSQGYEHCNYTMNLKKAELLFKFIIDLYNKDSKHQNTTNDAPNNNTGSNDTFCSSMHPGAHAPPPLDPKSRYPFQNNDAEQHNAFPQEQTFDGPDDTGPNHSSSHNHNNKNVSNFPSNDPAQKGPIPSAWHHDPAPHAVSESPEPGYVTSTPYKEDALGFQMMNSVLNPNSLHNRKLNIKMRLKALNSRLGNNTNGHEGDDYIHDNDNYSEKSFESTKAENSRVNQ